MKHKPPKKKKTENLYGNKPKQKAALKIIEILIDMIKNPETLPITYGELAMKIFDFLPEGFQNTRKELNGRRAQWIGRPLGCIWHTLYCHAKKTNRKIPYLMTLVINQKTKLPTIFTDEPLEWSENKIKKKRKEVFEFKHWKEILDEIKEKIETIDKQ